MNASPTQEPKSGKNFSIDGFLLYFIKFFNDVSFNLFLLVCNFHVKRNKKNTVKIVLILIKLTNITPQRTIHIFLLYIIHYAIYFYQLFNLDAKIMVQKIGFHFHNRAKINSGVIDTRYLVTNKCVIQRFFQCFFHLKKRIMVQLALSQSLMTEQKQKNSSH